MLAIAQAFSRVTIPLGNLIDKLEAGRKTVETEIRAALPVTGFLKQLGYTGEPILITITMRLGDRK